VEATPVAGLRRPTDDVPVPVVDSSHYLMAPLVALAALGLITLICRWVFSTDHREDRVARRLEQALAAGDYGLLVPVATVRTRDDAEMLRDVLTNAGLRVGVSQEAETLQVLVFQKDLQRARELVCAR
jgi:hypothetical protein